MATCSQLTNQWCFTCKGDTLHVKEVCNTCHSVKFIRRKPTMWNVRQTRAMTVRRSRAASAEPQKATPTRGVGRNPR
jgi:DnaJ-class molecular chaperone